MLCLKGRQTAAREIQAGHPVVGEMKVVDLEGPLTLT